MKARKMGGRKVGGEAGKIGRDEKERCRHTFKSGQEKEALHSKHLASDTLFSFIFSETKLRIHSLHIECEHCKVEVRNKERR